jgi:hypothetical protein
VCSRYQINFVEAVGKMQAEPNQLSPVTLSTVMVAEITNISELLELIKTVSSLSITIIPAMVNGTPIQSINARF